MNSERICWIHVRPLEEIFVTKYDKMSDLFGCQPALYKAENEYNTQFETLKDVRNRCSMRYGRPFWDVRDGIDVIFETKKTYMTSLGWGNCTILWLSCVKTCLASVTFKGVLMWHAGFMLMQVKGGVCLHLAKAFWHSPGSKSLFKEFISSHLPAWRLALHEMCFKQSPFEGARVSGARIERTCFYCV